MPEWKRNPERQPTGNELVHIKYRCGKIVGPVPKQSRRWVPWPSGDHDYDVEFYALAEDVKLG